MPESKNSVRGQLVLATILATLIGAIAGGAGFWFMSEPPPVPEVVVVTEVVEVPVEVIKIVEVEVEVPVEVVKIVEVPAPPRKPKPRPAPVAKVNPPPPAVAKVEPVEPELGPIPSGKTILDKAFARTQPGSHTRRVEILEHSEEGPTLRHTWKMARLHRKDRTITLGVVSPAESGPAGESRILSIETGKLEDQRFGYRPDVGGEVERVKFGEGTAPFGGSAFSFDDFRMKSSDQFVIHQVERTRVATGLILIVSVKPRYRAGYEKVDFIVDANDFALLETHFFRGVGLRPYRIMQYPRSDMEVHGKALVPMRVISRDLANGVIEEARMITVETSEDLDSKLFTLSGLKSPDLEIPNL